MTAAARSSPMPVSMFLLGSGRRLSGGLPTRLNCVKTRFQISTEPDCEWKKISLHGPQTPSGPWLGSRRARSYRLRQIVRSWFDGSLISSDQIFAASSSSTYTDTLSCAGGRPSHFLLVRNSQAHWIASRLK